MPALSGISWGRTWAEWYFAKGQFESEEEPPDYIKELYQTWEDMRTALDEDEHIRLGRELLRFQAENLWAIGTVGIPQLIVLKNNLRNFPENGVWGFDTIRAVPVFPEQFFFKTSA